MPLPATTGSAVADAPFALCVTAVYEDSMTSSWASQLCERVISSIGDHCLITTSWKVSDLTYPHVFPEAVQHAVEADVILICVQAAQDLPLDLYSWIDAWLPRRAGREGALVALVGTSTLPGSFSADARQYLQAVASRAGLDFFFQEHRPATESPRRPCLDRSREEVAAAKRVLRGQRSLCPTPAVYDGWGINE